MKRIPQLTFEYDPTAVEAVRMTKLIDELAPPMTKTEMKADLQAVAKAIREHDNFVLCTHENPDGDALGSMLAVKLALVGWARRARCSCPAPARFRSSTASWISTGCSGESPASWSGVPLIAVDAANEARLGSDQRLVTEAPSSSKIDHHHDNSRFGDVNLVVAEASSSERGAARRLRGARRFR